MAAVLDRPGQGRWIWEGDTHHSSRPIDRLSVAALAYLGVPIIVFFVTWLRPAYAILALGLSFAAVYVSRIHQRAMSWESPYTWQAMAVILAVGLSWSALGGGSHFVYANPDWLVRDAIIGDLTFSDWPPSYDFRDGTHYLLRSAIGFFLPVAAAAKVLGTQWIGLLVYSWTALGTVLFLMLLPLPNRSLGQLFMGLLVMAGFSGMDALGTLLLHGHFPVFPLRIEWWSDFSFRTLFSYSSLTGQLFWAPNHALPIWIATALFYRHWKSPGFLPFLFLLLPLLPLSSPFALAGLAPFIALLLLDYWVSRRDVERVPAAAIAFSLAIGALIFRLQVLDIDALPVRSGAAAAEIEGGTTTGFVRNYVAFVLMEFAVLGCVLFPILRHSRGIFLVAMGVLATLPLLTFGPSNDLLLRVSTPSLVLMAIICVRTLFEGSPISPARRGIIVVILAVGANTPFNEIWRAATWNRWPADYTRGFKDTQGGNLPAHYVGRLSDPILRSVLRTPSPVPSSRMRVGKQ